MSTTIRAVLLGLGLTPFSAIGTALVLTILFLGTQGHQSWLEMILFLLIATLPALLLSGMAAIQTIDTYYKKAITCGLVLPTIAICVWYGMGLTW
ncbi:MAG: hypothetical protein QM758_08405 [Armatimonas sp.]